MSSVFVPQVTPNQTGDVVKPSTPEAYFPPSEICLFSSNLATHRFEAHPIGGHSTPTLHGQHGLTKRCHFSACFALSRLDESIITLSPSLWSFSTPRPPRSPDPGPRDAIQHQAQLAEELQGAEDPQDLHLEPRFCSAFGFNERRNQ